MIKQFKKTINNKLVFIRRKIKITAAALAVVLVFTLLPGGTVIFPEAETTNSSVSKLRDQLKKNEQEQTKLKKEIASAKSEIYSMLQTKDYLDKQILLKEQNIEITEALIIQYEIEIGEMKKRLLEKESGLEKEYDNFRTQLRLSYEDKDINLFEVLFSSENLIDFLINSERTAILLEFRNSRLDDLQAQAADLNSLKGKYEEYLYESLIMKSQLEEAKTDLEQSKNQALGYIKLKEREMRQNEAEFQKLVKANDELDAELERQLKDLAAQSQRVYVGGKYLWPLDLKFNYISSYFSERTLNGIREFHKAIDIPANAGSNIYAANGGTIITAVHHYSYGNYIVIDHGGGQATLYAHCSKLLVKVGDTVSQGDVIGLVGTTGYSMGNHLHFEVRINGVAVNPLNGYVVKP